jgi:DNA-binding NtrC family response regulator
MIDTQGRVTYLSRNACTLLQQPAEDLAGKRWEHVLGINAQDTATLEAMSALPADRRTRVPVCIESSDERRFWIEIEILDDPRAGESRIFSLYDVSEIYDLRRQLDQKAEFENMIGKSSLMRRAFQQIQDVARVDATVLIEGETGTGKELVARALHFAGHRKDGPFVPVNCAGLTDSLLASQLFGHRKGAFTGAVSDQQGLFEAAEGGTLFLDEIGDISTSVQTSLLRVLQEKEITRLGESVARKIDVRVIAATHSDLDEEIKRGRFRADLFYRIRVARIQVPPLRARREDIPLLAEWFMRQSRAVTGKPVQDISNGAMRALMDYAWPGNVRELKSALEFAVILCKGPMLRVDDLPPEIAGSGPRPPAEKRSSSGDSRDDERRRLLSALERAGGNRAAAARLLGIGRTTLYRKLASLDIKPT